SGSVDRTQRPTVARPPPPPPLGGSSHRATMTPRPRLAHFLEKARHAPAAMIGPADNRTAAVARVGKPSGELQLLEYRDHAQPRRQRHPGTGREIARTQLATVGLGQHQIEHHVPDRTRKLVAAEMALSRAPHLDAEGE